MRGGRARHLGRSATGHGRTRAPRQRDEESLPAGLVVDAGGRGSRIPTWLAALGLHGLTPAEDRVKIGLGYASGSIALAPACSAVTWASSVRRCRRADAVERSPSSKATAGW